MSPYPSCDCGNVRRTYIDESYRTVGGGAEGVYLFAAVSVDAAEEDAIRQVLRKALPSRIRRFHWHADSQDTRDAATAALNAAESAELILLQSNVPSRSQEKSRQHGLWPLVVTMRDRCCHDLCFEARENQLNNRDKQTLANIKKSKVAGPLFVYRIGRPSDEPLLWLPDIALGVFGSNAFDDNPRWWAQLEVKPEVIDAPWRP